MKRAIIFSFAMLKWGNQGLQFQQNDLCDEFKITCSQTYKGVSDGGRCFFLGNNTANWTASWNVCERQGGTLAQIHSSTEVKAIGGYLKNAKQRSTDFIWIAGQRDQNSTLTWFLNNNNSHWFKSPNETDGELRGDNTWVWTHQKDDVNAGTLQYCFQLWPPGGYTSFGDWTCTDNLQPLCMVTNLGNNYSYFPNICVKEQAFYSLITISAVNCGMECDKLAWCRGFNYYNSGKCDLLSWTILDMPNKMNDSNCNHYSYAP